MGDLSINFSRKEFACNCGCGFDTVSEKLVKALQTLRDIVGKPIIITSACRCEKQNKNVGGKKDSQHLLGTAADIQVDGMSTLRLATLADTIPVFAKGGVGLYKTFVHVDVRNGRARWMGSRQ